MSIALDIPPVLVVTARWTDVGVRKEPLRPYGESTHKDTLVALDKMLGANAPTDVSEQVRRRLASGAARDLEICGRISRRRPTRDRPTRWRSFETAVSRKPPTCG